MDLAVLFTALARAADVDVFFVHVTKVADGKVLNHACAAVFTGDRTLLVDPSLRWFGVPHQQYSILNDREATAFLCFNNRGGDPKAVPVCHAGLKLWPDSAQGQLSLVGALCRTGQTQEARRVFEAMVEPESNTYETCVYWRFQGLFAEEDRDWERAEERLLKTIAVYPGQPGALFALARVYLQQRRPAEARAALRACLRHNPDAATAGAVRQLIAQINEEIGIGPIVDAAVEGSDPP
jgi:pentatricopeptide repeat protein